MPAFINNLEDFNKALTEAGDAIIVVDFCAKWCPPC